DGLPAAGAGAGRNRAGRGVPERALPGDGGGGRLNADLRPRERTDPVVNILVCAKRVPMTGGTIVLTEDEQSIQTRHLGFTISPHEECGVEEAVRLIEANGGESVVLALGPSEAEEQLRDAMALGIDRAILLETAVEFDLIFFGNESADSGNYQVGIRVAHALGRPCVTGVKGITVQDGRARCEQETASGRDLYGVPLPAVVTVKE